MIPRFSPIMAAWVRSLAPKVYTGRVDHKFSDRDMLHGTFLLVSSSTSTPDATDFVETAETSQNRMASLEETQVFQPDLVNIARAGEILSTVGNPRQIQFALKLIF